MASHADLLIKNVLIALTMSRQVDLRMVDQIQKCAHDWERENLLFSEEERHRNRQMLQPMFWMCEQAAASAAPTDDAVVLMYLLYNATSKIAYYACADRKPVPAAMQQTSDEMRRRRYAFLDGSLREHTRDGLARLWALMDTCTSSDYPRSGPYSNYIYGAGQGLENQFPLNSIPQHVLDDVQQYLRNTGIATVLEHYLGSHVGISNIRVWRYGHGKNTGVEMHRDKLPPSALKVMLYRGEIQVENGCFEFVDGQELKQVVGDYPVCICETNLFRHRALPPAENRIRDTVELLVMPRIEDDLPVVSAGYAGGYPRNPFKAWAS